MNRVQNIKVGIFTGRTLEPLHPRLESVINVLDSECFVHEINAPVRNKIFENINWLSLFFFDNYSVYKYKKQLKKYNIILLQDMKFLPLARYARKEGKKVIYETLDNNVTLREYQLESRFKFFKYFKRIIIYLYSKKEKRIALKKCDLTIVNSKALKQYFNNRAELIYYCSSLEYLFSNHPANKPSLLYLGAFTIEKGAIDIIELQNDTGLDLYIFGTINDNIIKTAISGNSHIHFTDKLNQSELRMRIGELLKENFLIGLSMIKPVNFSYSTQEANKEIDYLSLGIPMIGNHRMQTAEKIDAGCGVFFDDKINLKKIMSDSQYRDALSKQCIRYYDENYSVRIFTMHYKEALNSLISKPNA